MSLQDEIRESFQHPDEPEQEPEAAPPEDAAVLHVVFPRNGEPEMTLENGQLLSLPKIQIIERMILKKIREQRAKALHAQHKREEESNDGIS